VKPIKLISLVIGLLALMSGVLAASEARATSLKDLGETAQLRLRLSPMYTSCNNCKAWNNWYGGAAGGSTSFLIPITDCFSGCTQVEEAYWAKDNTGSYVDSGIITTYDLAENYFYAYYSQSLGYNQQIVTPVYITDYGKNLFLQAEETGYSFEQVVICGGHYCNQIATPVPSALFLNLEDGTRIWENTLGSATIPTTDMTHNEWEDNNTNWHYQYVDGSFLYNYNPPYLQNQHWVTHPSPATYGGDYQTYCVGPSYQCY